MTAHDCGLNEETLGCRHCDICGRSEHAAGCVCKPGMVAPSYDEARDIDRRLNMVKVAIIKKPDNKFITREYHEENDLMTRDKTMEYGEWDWLEDAVLNLAETYKGREFIIRLKI